ncbi:hypothetical protein BGX34_001730, partial [Mortierella sp. NVP85]
FLERDPNERLGVKGGMSGIRRQLFFWTAAREAQMSLDQWWHLLETKQLTPKFQPPAEAANFDATFDLEELLLDGDPLTYQSTRRRVQRQQRERERAMKEKQAKLKAEHEAALAVALEAEAAMEEMNRKLEEGMRKAQKVAMAAHLSSKNSTASKNSVTAPSVVSKKKSRLQLFGSGDSSDSSRDGQRTMPQPQPQSHNSNSQSSRQTQFQSIPLSPVEAPDGTDELPIPPIPSFLMDASSQEKQYPYESPTFSIGAKPSPIRRDTAGSTTSGYQIPQYTKPVTPVKADLKRGESGPLDPTLIRRRESGQSTKENEAAVFMRPGTPVDLPSSQEYAVTLQQQQHPFQAAHPQMAISTPVIIPTQDHSLVRQKHIPTQQPQPPLRHQTPQPVGIGPRRPTSPLGLAINIEAEAAAMADMTPDQRHKYQLDLIEREFTTFDYTVYESYHGLVDPVTMSVGNPPEWVRSLD